VLILVIGLFAVGESDVSGLAVRREEMHVLRLEKFTGMTRDEWSRSWKPWLRGTAIGFPLGVLPCGGPVIPTFLSYLARSASVVSRSDSVTARSKACAARRRRTTRPRRRARPAADARVAFVGDAAVLLAAFEQYGLQPGPLLFSSRPDLVWTLIASLYIGNVMLLVLNLPLAACGRG
jgi:putative tricarboxylic transport membrane protein